MINESKKNPFHQKLITISILSVLIVIFIILCTLTLTGVFSGFENSVYEFLYNLINPVLTGFARVLTFVGFFPILIGVGLLLEVIPKTRHKLGFQAALAAGAGYLINYIFKVIFQRPRPVINQIINSSGLSFPSGHSAAAGAFFATIIIFIILNIKDKRVSIPTIILCAIMPLVVALSRVYLGVHYITDTITGIVLGTIVAMLISLILWPLLKRKLTKFTALHIFLFGQTKNTIMPAEDTEEKTDN